ncbi:MAG: hypothetical protein J6Y28_03750 [Acholeplasmatales bacterium]|nr:hypothetical protein [Acholeplasmatales bacterium]
MKKVFLAVASLSLGLLMVGCGKKDKKTVDKKGYALRKANDFYASAKTILLENNAGDIYTGTNKDTSVIVTGSMQTVTHKALVALGEFEKNYLDDVSGELTVILDTQTNKFDCMTTDFTINGVVVEWSSVAGAFVAL